MNVLFLGTPDFACPSLEALVKAGHRVVSVVTRPDKPTGRGRKLVAPPVKRLAESFGLPVRQPARVNAPETVAELAALAPEVVVVVAFGAILRKPLLTLGRLGAVNVHASLLPAYRGVAPVQWGLIHGDRNAGVTTMLMDEGVDTGPALERLTVEPHPGETAGQLLDRLAVKGAELLITSLRGLGEGTVKPVPQPTHGVSYAPRLEREHGYLDLSRTAIEVENQFRGVTPAPGARVFLGEAAIRVLALRSVPGASGEPYRVLGIEGRHVRVATGAGAVDLLVVRPPGRGDMEGAAFARGRGLGPESRFTPPPVVPELGLLATVPR